MSPKCKGNLFEPWSWNRWLFPRRQVTLLIPAPQIAKTDQLAACQSKEAPPNIPKDLSQFYNKHNVQDTAEAPVQNPFSLYSSMTIHERFLNVCVTYFHFNNVFEDFIMRISNSIFRRYTLEGVNKILKLYAIDYLLSPIDVSFVICLSVCVLVAQLRLTLCNPWTIACQGPLSMGFSWQEYWSGLPFPPRWALPDPRIKPVSPVSPALHRFFTRWAKGEVYLSTYL